MSQDRVKVGLVRVKLGIARVKLGISRVMLGKVREMPCCGTEGEEEVLEPSSYPF